MKTINFMGHKNLWFGISIAVIALGLLFLVIHGGLNMGIDFIGGTSIHAKLGKAFDIDEVRQLTDTFDKEATVTYAGQNRDEVIIKTKIEFDSARRTEITTAFSEKYGVQKEDISFESVGPAIGNELKTQSAIALLLAFAAILLYVSFRFEWKFGVAAIAALVHDVTIMVVAYAVFDIPVNGTFIAALLTIIGYSINDTIVIFDRIRENLKLEHKKIDYTKLVNESVTQTLARSINTSLTTLLTVLALYFLGVPAIKEFALPMIVGVVSGSYSTIFIASPLWATLCRPLKAKASLR